MSAKTKTNAALNSYAREEVERILYYATHRYRVSLLHRILQVNVRDPYSGFSVEITGLPSSFSFAMAEELDKEIRCIFFDLLPTRMEFSHDSSQVTCVISFPPVGPFFPTRLIARAVKEIGRELFDDTIESIWYKYSKWTSTT
jgi:hypothetical protein